MLVQVGGTLVPGHDAYVRHACIRGIDFAASMLWSRGVATDWGVQARFVEYIARQTRSQLSIVLAGRGYVMGESGAILLREGDVVELDQLRHDDEGYGGSPCEVLVVEWEDGGSFGSARRGPPRCSRLSRREVDRLRALMERLNTHTAVAWARELVAQLRAAGLPAPRLPEFECAVPPNAARIYSALGAARGRMDRHPTISELAEELGLSERHVRRGFEQLEREFRMTISGFRDFVSDARLSHAQQLLSIRELSLQRVATLSGFRSAVALSHAFSARASMTPGAVARVLAERWF